MHKWFGLFRQIDRKKLKLIPIWIQQSRTIWMVLYDDWLKLNFILCWKNKTQRLGAYNIGIWIDVYTLVVPVFAVLSGKSWSFVYSDLIYGHGDCMAQVKTFPSTTIKQKLMYWPARVSQKRYIVLISDLSTANDSLRLFLSLFHLIVQCHMQWPKHDDSSFSRTKKKQIF